MQVFDIVQAMTLGLPGIIAGTIVGYIIGSLSMSRNLKVFLALTFSIVGGLLLVVAFQMFIRIDTLKSLLAFMAFVGGIAFGLMVGWVPERPPGPSRHVVFDPEEDDIEFERQLQSALGVDEE